MSALIRFPVGQLARSVSDVPKISDEDKLYAKRLGQVLRTLRENAGLRQADVEEKLGLSEGTLGRWERGTHAPKGYNFGRLFRYYEPHGAELDMFLDPPEVVVVNPIRDRLAATPLRPVPSKVSEAEAAVRSRLPEIAADASSRRRSRKPQADPSPPSSKRPSARATARR